MSAAAPGEGPAGDRTHLYDAVAAQREQVVGGFADQREALVRAIEEQRLAAMPQHLRLAALGPAQVSAEIVQALQQFIAKEVTRQLHLAITTALANTKSKNAQEPIPEERPKEEP
jgi:fumarate hydratase class II